MSGPPGAAGRGTVAGGERRGDGAASGRQAAFPGVAPGAFVGVVRRVCVGVPESPPARPHPTQNPIACLRTALVPDTGRALGFCPRADMGQGQNPACAETFEAKPDPILSFI